MSAALSLGDAERYCRDMARREAKNFYWGFISLPYDRRIAIYALYDFARQVDDEADARELVQEFLSGRGARVTTASSADDAWRRFGDLKPDVIITDIGMPLVSGLTLVRRIRELPAEEGGGTPAVAVTGFASRDDARIALAAGFQAHLSKPLQLDKLVETVARLGECTSDRSARPRPERS